MFGYILDIDNDVELQRDWLSLCDIREAIPLALATACLQTKYFRVTNISLLNFAVI